MDGTPDEAAGFAQGRSLGDLMLLGSRLYDPEAARFLAPDPVFQLVNQYAYAGGNPVWYWDPDGRLPTSAAAFAIGVGVAGTAVGVATVAVAAAGTAVASPIALAIGIGIIASSNAFMIGAVAPYSTLVANAALNGGVWAGNLARVSLAFAPLAGVLGGFASGQAFQSGFHDPSGPSGYNGRNADPRHRTQHKDLDLEAEAVIAVGQPGGGPPGGPGCSPASLATRPPASALRWLAAGLSLQAILLVAMLVRGRGEKNGRAA